MVHAGLDSFPTSRAAAPLLLSSKCPSFQWVEIEISAKKFPLKVSKKKVTFEYISLKMCDSRFFFW
jgi:hypothetical protein